MLIDEDATAIISNSHATTAVDNNVADGLLVNGSEERGEENNNNTTASEASTGRVNNVLVVDRILTYDNVPEQQRPSGVKDFILSDSLLTISSQAGTASFLHVSPDRQGEEAEAQLSFHASQIDSSDELQDTIHSERALAVEEAQPEDYNLDVLVNVGNQLLQQEQEDKTPVEKDKQNQASSKTSPISFKIFLLVIITVTSIVGKTMLSMPADNKIVDIGGAFQEQEMEENPLSTITANATIEEMGQSPGSIISVEKYGAAQDSEDHSDDRESPKLLSKSQVERATWTLFFMFFVAFLATTAQPLIKTEESKPKQECVAKNEQEWDLGKYEKLKVVEIRELLRSRKCKTVGKKAILVRRLAAVYRAELETLTVRQLRPILKSKGCKQVGRKVQLIQKLVEAGI